MSAGNIGAQLRAIKTAGRQGVFMRVLADGIPDGQRIEVDAEVLGESSDEKVIAEVLGGARTPYGIPRAGELWFGILLGGDLNHAFLALPLSRVGGVDLGILEPGVTAWTPPPGDTIKILTRALEGEGGDFEISADGVASVDASGGLIWTTQEAATLDADGGFSFNVQGHRVEISSSGGVYIGDDTINGFESISKILGWLGDTLTDLATATVNTMLGPASLSNAGSYALRAVVVIAHKKMFDTLLD